MPNRVVFISIEVPDDLDAFHYLQSAIVPGVKYEWLMGRQVYNTDASRFAQVIMRTKDKAPKFRAAVYGRPVIRPSRYYIVRDNVAVVDQWPTGYDNKEAAQQDINRFGQSAEDLHVVKGDQFEV
jgi:hypothetical protein